MNERIKELAVEAGLKYHNWITNESNIKDGDFKYPRFEDYEKFAELIVRECVEVCNRVYFDNYPDAEDFERSEEGDAIKQHFGVA